MSFDEDDQHRHQWELRGVDFDLHVGTIEEYECRGCPAVTARTAAASQVSEV